MKYEIIKGSEKDFEGVTNKDVVRVYDTGQTKFYAVTEEINSVPDDWTIIAERRPIAEPVVNQQLTTEWDGEGLPPVGCDAVLRGIRETTEGEYDIREHCQVNLWRNGDVVKVLMIDDSKTGKPLAVVWNYKDKTACGILASLLIKIDVARDEAKGIIAEICRSSASNGHSADSIYDAIASGRIKGLTKTPTVSELMRVTEKSTREDCEAIVKLMGGAK